MPEAALLNEAVLPAVKDGGRLATVRGWVGPVERGMEVVHISVAFEWLSSRKLAGCATWLNAMPSHLGCHGYFRWPRRQRRIAHWLLAGSGGQILDFPSPD